MAPTAEIAQVYPFLFRGLDSSLFLVWDDPFSFQLPCLQPSSNSCVNYEFHFLEPDSIRSSYAPSAGKGFWICTTNLMFSTISNTPFLSPGVLQLVFPFLSIGCSLFWSCLPEFSQLPELIATTPVRYPWITHSFQEDALALLFNFVLKC